MMMMMVVVVSNGYHATRDLQTVASPGGGRQRRAVAVVKGGEWELRAPRQRLSMFWPSVCSTAGEVALPGGKRDEEDEDDAATALREAQEEIGLEPSQVRVVAVFEPFLSKHLLAVTPVVGLLRENSKFTPTGNPAEVESIFDTPLEMFLKEKTIFSSELKGNELQCVYKLQDEAHRYKDQIWQDTVYRVHFFNFETLDGVKYSIWGLTASILIRAACVIFQRQPAFMEVAPHSVNFSKKGGENPKN
ncbi:hypothetical protein BDL97_03G054700 [Sphagnum fallax]|nr:hypothetical protein BDL97_03G054700 [Sphagnum fallax]